MFHYSNSSVLQRKLTKQKHLSTTMFGSWKSRVRQSDKDNDDGNSEAAAVVQLVTSWDDETLSEIEEELSTFINRQLAWQGLSKAKQIPSWMKTASLNRCAKTPPLPPKTGPPAAPPRSRRSRSRLRDLGGSLSSTSWTPTPPLRRARSRSSTTTSLQSILPPQLPWAENWPRLHVSSISSTYSSCTFCI